MQSKRIQEAVSPWMNILIEAIAVSVIFISAVLTANYFGIASSNHVVQAQATIYAFGVDGMFYICVRLTRHYLAHGWSWRGVGLGLWWMAWSFAMGAFTWHNNLLFAANDWQLNQQALARAGVSDNQELQLHAIIPVVIVLLVALIPRPGKKDSRTPEQIEEDARQELALLQAKQQVRAAKAQLAGKNLRGTIGGFLGASLDTEERRQQEMAAAQAHDARLEQQAKERAQQLQILRIATEQYGTETVERYTIKTPDGEYETDWLGLEDRLRDDGYWPPAVAALPTIEKLQEQATSPTPRLMLSEGSGPLPDYLTIAEVAKAAKVSESSVRYWLKTGKIHLSRKKFDDKHQRISLKELVNAGVTMGQQSAKRAEKMADSDPALPVVTLPETQAQPNTESKTTQDEGTTQPAIKATRRSTKQNVKPPQPEPQEEEIE